MIPVLTHDLVRRLYLCSLVVAMFAPTVRARPRRSGTQRETAQVEVVVIRAERGGHAYMDSSLMRLASDLRSLPFKRFSQQKRQSVTVSTLQGVRRVRFPKDNRTIDIRLVGYGNDKLRLKLMLSDGSLQSSVGIPDGGTILIAGPKEGRATLIFALTAHRIKKNALKRLPQRNHLRPKRTPLPVPPPLRKVPKSRTTTRR